MIQVVIVQTGHDVRFRVARLFNDIDQVVIDDESLAMERIPFLFRFTKSSSVWILICIVEELDLNLFIALF